MTAMDSDESDGYTDKDLDCPFGRPGFLDVSGPLCHPASMSQSFLEGLLEEDVIKVEGLIAAGANIQSPCRLLYTSGLGAACEGDSALHIASRMGSLPMLQLLLQYGAEVDSVSETGETCLHIACVRAQVECVKLLLQHGASVNAMDKIMGSDTALIKAVACYNTLSEDDDSYIEIIQMLIQTGAEVNKSDCKGLTALHLAVCKEDTRISELLLNNGAIIDTQGELVSSPLIRAIECGSIANVNLLLREGCKVNHSWGCLANSIPLCSAILSNNMAIVLDLLRHGADPNFTSNGGSALHLAASRKYLVMLLLLLAKDGNINTQMSFDRASLLLTLTRERSEIGVCLLLKLGANPNLENKLGTTPIWAAVKLQLTNLVRLYICVNCDLERHSIELFTYRPITAVQLALELGHLHIAFLLLNAGCVLNRSWISGPNAPRKLQKNSSVLYWFQQWLSQPRTLKFLCRSTLRRSIGLPLPKFMQSIQYPLSLKEYLLCRDY